MRKNFYLLFKMIIDAYKLSNTKFYEIRIDKFTYAAWVFYGLQHDECYQDWMYTEAKPFFEEFARTTKSKSTYLDSSGPITRDEFIANTMRSPTMSYGP
ncbi:hypothetical protein OAT84_01300 [Gammaproteobacteria bacterium]|nr:hypothetical protein [Gammaproteobacteria bacterium]